MGGRGVLGLTPGGGWVFVFVALCLARPCGRCGRCACGYALSYILGVVPP